MKDYYDILDVPLNASVEQIKSRYKQLVRIYHPDRFSNALDKVYAEHKLKQVNEAYAFLTSDYEGMTYFNTFANPPVPVVEPAVLDFGVLRPGDQQVLRFAVDNTGGPATGVSFVCSEENSWFRVSNGKRIEQSKTLPMIFEVVADIRPNYPPRHYGGWIEISMSGVSTRVELQADVQEAQVTPTFQLPTFQLPVLRVPAFQTRHRLFALAGLFCLLAVLFNAQFSQSITDLFDSYRQTQSAALVSAASEPAQTPIPPTPTNPPPTATVPPSPVVSTVAVITRVVEPVKVAQVTTPTNTPTPLPLKRQVSPAQERIEHTSADGADAAALALAALFAASPTVNGENSPTPLPTATATAAPTIPVLPSATPTVPPPTATPLPPPTATSTHTPVPLPTATPPPPTATPVTPPTATALPNGGLYEIILADGSTSLALTLEIPLDRTVNVRYAWDIRSPALAVLVGGTRLPAVGRSNDSTWVQVALPNGQLGWIFTEVIDADLNQIAQLPMTLAPQWP